jgi:hypothetical protein
MPRYLSGVNKRREIAAQQALLDRLEARFTRSIGTVLSASMKAAVEQYERDGSDVSVESTILGFNDRLGRVIQNDWKAAMQTFGQRILEARVKHRPIEKKDEEDIFDQAIANYLRQYQATKITQISQTTARQVKQLIEIGVADGLSSTQIAKEISQKIPGISRIRAKVIARTETHTAANIGAYAAAEATGLNLIKEWASAVDERTREDHLEANGQQVGLNESFIVGGEELNMPGDPSGSAENIINCRCVALFLEA